MDAKKIAVDGLKGSCGMILQDLQALPEDAFDKSFGSKTRTVADIVYEVTLVNDHIGMVMRGEEPFAWPEGGWITAPEDRRTKESAIAGFEQSTRKIVETAESFSSEQFEEPLKTEEGETTRFERCRFMTVHNWYHSGQLNYIQTMMGDDAWNWS